MQRFLLAALCLLACRPATIPAPRPVTRIPAELLVAPEPAVEAGPTSSTGDYGFAPSPLTGIANRLLDLACAVVERRPLPASPFPIAPEPSPSNPESLMRESSRELFESCRELEFFALATEITLSHDVAAGERRGVEVVAFLSRSGLKIGMLDSGSAGRHAAEGAMSDVAATGKLLGEAICADRGGELVLGEPERAVIANDALWEKIARLRPKGEDFLAAKQGLAHPRYLKRRPRPPISGFGFVFAVLRCSRTSVRSAPVLAKASPKRRTWRTAGP